jgi:hypothetical protein
MGDGHVADQTAPRPDRKPLICSSRFV